MCAIVSAVIVGFSTHGILQYSLDFQDTARPVCHNLTVLRLQEWRLLRVGKISESHETFCASSERGGIDICFGTLGSALITKSVVASQLGLAMEALENLFANVHVRERDSRIASNAAGRYCTLRNAGPCATVVFRVCRTGPQGVLQKFGQGLARTANRHCKRFRFQVLRNPKRRNATHGCACRAPVSGLTQCRLLRTSDDGAQPFSLLE